MRIVLTYRAQRSFRRVSNETRRVRKETSIHLVNVKYVFGQRPASSAVLSDKDLTVFRSDLVRGGAFGRIRL